MVFTSARKRYPCRPIGHEGSGSGKVAAIFCLFLFGFILSISSANASLVTATYMGSLEGFDYINPEIKSAFSPSDKFTMTVIYESSSVDQRPADPYLGIYTGAVQSLTFSIGSYNWNAEPGGVGIQVYNDYPVSGSTFDSIWLYSYHNLQGPEVNGWKPDQFDLSFSEDTIDAMPSVLTSDALPLQQLDPAQFHRFAFMEVDFLSPDGQTSTSLNTAFKNEPAPVPIPGSVWLFGSALGCLGLCRLRTLARG